jgi:hypothetical protein
MFNKKVRVNYLNILSEKDAKKMIQTIPNNFPSYFNSIPKTYFDPTLKKSLPFLRTIKSCPGFINLYKRSILITSPYDLYAEFDNEKILFQEVGRTKIKPIHFHENYQFLSYIDNKDYKFIIKIDMPFSLDSNVSFLLNDSSYHFNKFKVLPGILNKSYDGDSVNFFIPIKKNTKELHIRQGDPLFLLTPMCEDKINLSFKKVKNFNVDKNKLTFSSLKYYVMDKLI